MFLLIGCGIVIIVAIIAIAKSKKPVKLIMAEAKYEIIYHALGSKAMVQDFLMKGKNKTDLPLNSGKVAVITGGTRGIGLEVIKMLLKCDVTVVIGCRDTKKGDNLAKTFKDEGLNLGNIDVFQLDISFMDSVREFAQNVKSKYPKINFLINNAGIMFGPYIESRDGYESQFATNYLGHFLLTHLLLPEIIAAGKGDCYSRIVNVSSCAHEVGDINFDDINFRSRYIPAEAYAQSKLAQILFSNYLNSLLESEKVFVQAMSVHPGIVNTDLFNESTLKSIVPWAPALFFKTPPQGALPIIYATLSPELEGKGGLYVHNCQIYQTSAKAMCKELQRKLFEYTKDLLKIENFASKF